MNQVNFKKEMLLRCTWIIYFSELGAHIDGFLAIAAHTIVIGEAAEGRKADVILAAYKAV